MGWKHAFGGAFNGGVGCVFEIPGFIISLVEKNLLRDLSHKDDVAPSFGFYDPLSGVEVRLWVDHPIQSLRETEGSRFAVTVGSAGQVDDSWDFNELEVALDKLFEEISTVRERTPAAPFGHEDPWADPNYYLRTLQEEYWHSR